MSNIENNTGADELSEAELEQVSGGLNPQPLPPHEIGGLTPLAPTKTDCSGTPL